MSSPEAGQGASAGHLLFAWHAVICKVFSWTLPHWVHTVPSDALGWMVSQRDSVTCSGLYRAAKARSSGFPSHVPFHGILCWETVPGTKFLHGHLWVGQPPGPIFMRLNVLVSLFCAPVLKVRQQVGGRLLIFEVCFEDGICGNGGWGQLSRCFYCVKRHRKGPASPGVE